MIINNDVLYEYTDVVLKLASVAYKFTVYIYNEVNRSCLSLNLSMCITDKLLLRLIIPYN